MFKLNEKYEFNRSILKCNYVRYAPSEMSTINTADSQYYMNIPREDSVISFLYDYLDLNFDVLHAATGNRYADGNDIRLVILGPIALCNSYRLAISGKHLEDISHEHIVSSMYELITSARDTDDLSIGFDRDCARARELTNNINQEGKYHVRVMHRDIFGFVEHQEKATYGLGYKLTLTRNSDNCVFNKANATNNAKVKVYGFEWYVSHYTPSIPQQALFSKQILSKIPTELQYIERSFFLKEVNTEILWTFELGTQ